MNFILDNFSIVVLAEAHNPSILNPDFLKNQGIIAPSFTAQNVICTPPVAQVSYKEGITIIAEFDKLQFIDTSVERIPFDSPISDITVKYINTLPHVRYKAVGLNFTGHYLCKDKETASALLSSKFLKEGKWSSLGDSMPYVGIKFSYLFSGVRCTINFDTADVVYQNMPPVPVIAIKSNYQVTSDGIEELIAFINDWKKDYKHFSDSLLDTFSGGNYACN